MDEQSWSDAVAATIRAERGAANLTQDDLAERAGMSTQTYRRYDTGVRLPNIVQVIRIAEALNMRPSEFVAAIEARANANASVLRIDHNGPITPEPASDFPDMDMQAKRPSQGEGGEGPGPPP